jgi:rhodanese-related sulfurtransferase
VVFLKLLNLFRKPAGLKDVEPEQLQQIVSAARTPVVIDVRTAMEYKAGHIHSALPYPLGKEILAAQDLKPETPIVLVCKTGHRSQAAAHTFAQLGFRDISHLAGGMDRWKKKKLPLEK